MSTTVIVAYRRGTGEMMSACLGSLARHTKDIDVIVVTSEGGIDAGLMEGVECFRSPSMPVEVIEVPANFIKPMREHGSLLDRVITTRPIETELLLTLDSDCFPIADWWLDELDCNLRGNVVTTGILHPWEPPPEDMPHNLIEWRVRSQLCRKTTHVACQLVRVSDVKEAIAAGHGYATGDDTGLGLVSFLKRKGICTGYSLSRCPKPAVPFDAEFNRYSCLVYGDCVVHVGGHSRIVVGGDDDVFSRAFSWAVNRILEDGGAEFLLDDANAYKYVFDKEEEVAREKMQRAFGLEEQRMKV